MRRHVQRRAGGQEDAGVGLGHAKLAGGDRYLEMLRQTDNFKVCIAIRDGAEQHALAHPGQARQDVVIRLDAVARGQEVHDGPIDQGGILAGGFEGRQQAGAAQLDQIAMEMRLRIEHGQAVLAQHLDGKLLRHPGRMRGQPVVQQGFGSGNHGRDGPQGIVEIEQDGLGRHGGFDRGKGHGTHGGCRATMRRLHVLSHRSPQPAWLRLREMGPGQRFPAKNCYRVIQGKIIRLAR